MPCCGPRNSEATMTLNDYLQLGLYLAIILAATPLLGRYLTGLFNGEARWLRPIERPLYALAGVDPAREQHWTTYAIAMLALRLAGFLSLFSLLRFQDLLPLNPQGLPALSPHLALPPPDTFLPHT